MKDKKNLEQSVKPSGKGKAAERTAAEAGGSGKTRRKKTNQIDGLTKVAIEVIHELNNFLGAVASNERVLEKMAAQIKDKHLQASFLETINSNKMAIRQISSTIKSLKRAYHPERISLKPSMVNVNQAIENILGLLIPENQGISFIKELSELPLIAASEGIIERIVMNLLHNAVQAVKDSGFVMVSTSFTDDKIGIRVNDNGQGIPEKIRGQIFEPHFTTKEAGRGTGLGLAIIRQLIEEELNGVISFKSTVGVGTTFCVELPVTDIEYYI